jgi:hypothetical protein
MLRSGLCLALLLSITACNDSTTDQSPIDPSGDGGMGGGTGAAGAACTTDADCIGTCVGDADGPVSGNPRFAGGYCTNLGCTPESQDGCGADEWCVDMGFDAMCVALCSKADGLECQREDHVCLGLGTFGGCFSEEAVECTRGDGTNECDEDRVCVRIGLDDSSLGRCELTCDPMVAGGRHPNCEDDACYYIRSYNEAICTEAGDKPLEESCACDKCCLPGLACTPDLDGTGKHCKEYCVVATGQGCATGEMCVPIETDSPLGGCVAPGSAGT